MTARNLPLPQRFNNCLTALNHTHFSDIAYANRNETKHLPNGEGTLRAEPLRDALARFGRPATVISESPDEESTQSILAVLDADPPG